MQLPTANNQFFLERLVSCVKPLTPTSHLQHLERWAILTVRPRPLGLSESYLPERSVE